MQEKYTAALYSYFRVINSRSAFQKLLDNRSKAPSFTHHERLNAQTVEDKLAQINLDLNKYSKNKIALSFLEWRKSEYKILEQFCVLRDKKVINEQDIDAYLDAQYTLYGTLDKELFTNIMAFLKRKAGEYDKLPVWESIAQDIHLSPSSSGLPAPSQKVFDEYSRIFQESVPELWEVLNSINGKKKFTSDEVKDYFKRALVAIGADKAGWTIISARAGTNIVVSKYKKKIILPYSYNSSSSLRLKQTIAHEVGGHIQRSLTTKERDYNGYDDAEEGFAILLEQLVDDHFVHKRAMRFFAICLSVGIDGQRRNFNQVFEILLKTYEVMGYGTKSATSAAFSETTRAFRGGLPSVPGAVYIKDKIYLEGNLKVWRNLQEKQLSAEEFRQLFNGHDTIHGEA